MLDVLLSLVKEHAGDAIINNTDVPNEHNDAAISATADGILGFLKDKAEAGDYSELLGLVQGAGSNLSQEGILQQLQGGTIFQGLAEKVTKEIAARVGVSETIAMSVAKQMLPGVFSKFVKKVADPKDSSVTIDSVLTAIGMPAGIGGMLGGLFGGGTDNNQNSGLGGMLSALGGLMK